MYILYSTISIRVIALFFPFPRFNCLSDGGHYVYVYIQYIVHVCVMCVRKKETYSYAHTYIYICMYIQTLYSLLYIQRTEMRASCKSARWGASWVGANNRALFGIGFNYTVFSQTLSLSLSLSLSLCVCVSPWCSPVRYISICSSPETEPKSLIAILLVLHACVLSSPIIERAHKSVDEKEKEQPRETKNKRTSIVVLELQQQQS